MPEYKLVKKTVSTDWHAGGPTTVEIPDDARFLDVRYDEPPGRSEPTLEAEIRYLAQVEGDPDA